MLGAGGGRFFGVGAFAFAFQVVLGHAAVDQIPRQNFVKTEGAVGVEGGVDPGARKVVHPLVVIEVFAPRRVRRTLAGGEHERGGEPAVAAREHRLDPRNLRVVVVVDDLAVGDLVFQVELFFLQHLKRILPLPLERGEGFGDEAGHADRIGCRIPKKLSIKVPHSCTGGAAP